jgi:hypothetical protein
VNARRPGDQATVREILHGHVWAARPFTVVCDRPDLLALYLAPGAHQQVPASSDGSLPAMDARSWGLMDRVWQGHGALELVLPGAAHAWVAIWSGPERRLDHWYVNFQDPLRRTAIGYDTLDLVLDLMVSPDLSAWRWKDETDFEEEQRRGRVSPEAADCIRREADSVQGSSVSGDRREGRRRWHGASLRGVGHHDRCPGAPRGRLGSPGPARGRGRACGDQAGGRVWCPARRSQTSRGPRVVISSGLSSSRAVEIAQRCPNGSRMTP